MDQQMFCGLILPDLLSPKPPENLQPSRSHFKEWQDKNWFLHPCLALLFRGGYAYAESRDGIHWMKPKLGVVEFRGSKANNLFYTFAPDGKNLVDEELARRGTGLPALDEKGKQIGLLNNADGLTVIRDETET